MLNTFIAGSRVVLPDPDRIPVAVTRDAVLRATELAGHATDRAPREFALLAEIRAAVLEEQAEWAAHAEADAATALAGLSLIIDAARELREELYASVGVAGMLARLDANPDAPLAVQHTPYGWTFDMNPAIELLEHAFAAVAEELDQIKASRTKTTPEIPTIKEMKA